MILQAAKDFKIDLLQSYTIGDSLIDIQVGKKVGCKTILISNQKDCLFPKLKKKVVCPDYVASNLLEATEIIKKISKK